VNASSFCAAAVRRPAGPTTDASDRKVVSPTKGQTGRGGLAPAGPKSGQASDWKVVELTAGPTTDASDRKVVSPTKGQTGRRS
jgi:hypothetical protein